MPDYAYCPLCGNVNRADLGPVTGMFLDGRACRRRQAGLELANPDGVPMPERRYPVQVRDIIAPDLAHEHETCDWTGDPYLCPVPGCWWNQGGTDELG